MKLLGAALFVAGFVLLAKAIKRSDTDMSGSDTKVLNNALLGLGGIGLAVTGAIMAVFG